ncbi:MAG: hypothetical protein JNM88_12290 [Chitinophagaceae bacterium]|nr:hypothetical protein [Chitinophagaceae bacterium]
MSNTRNTKPLPDVFIPKEEVNLRVKKFMDLKHPLLTSAMGKEETKSAWYSLEQFEQVMREMYYQNADGLRIYFGAYPESDPVYGGQLTIIFVPTRLDTTSGKHKDVIIDDDINYDDRKNQTDAQDSEAAFFKGLDTFGLCPPSCIDQDCSFPYTE